MSSGRILTNGLTEKEMPDYRDLKEDGQQKAYVILSDEERAKGFVRIVREVYVHEKCGAKTTMNRALAETYARDPYFYSATFCCTCAGHYPVSEFCWEGTQEKVGS